MESDSKCFALVCHTFSKNKQKSCLDNNTRLTPFVLGRYGSFVLKIVKEEINLRQLFQKDTFLYPKLYFL
jgi:hypothetical protein